MAKSLKTALLAVALALPSLRLQAQTAVNLGPRLPLEKGPWVLGEVLFISSNSIVNDYTWRDRVRGTRGALYTMADIDNDVDNLKGLRVFSKIEPAIFEMPGVSVPAEFSTIAISTSQVRLVFFIAENAVAQSSAPARRPFAPAPLSGIILTPTAYRGTGKFTTPGLGLDINALYVIGRLYGVNNYANAPSRSNYIDRVGVWLLTADGKMQVQSEERLRPALAVGGQGSFMFRDTSQPSVNDPNPAVKVNASQKSTKLFSDAYFVASKKIGPARASLGFMEGNLGDVVAQFSEFLSPDGLRFFSNCTNDGAAGAAGCQSGTVTSHSMPFASLLFLPKPQYPISIEYIRFNGAALHPFMVNLKIGYFLHMNFDVGILKFDGGWDVLGMLAFRYSQFPGK